MKTLLIVATSALLVSSCGVVKEEDKCILTSCGNESIAEAAKPTVTSPTSNPFYSSGNSVTLSGSCITDATVTLAGAETQTATCVGSTYSFTLSATTEGAKTYSISQTMLDVTSAGTSFVWNRDVTNPAAPTISAPNTNPYTSGKKILALSGSCEAGSTVNITGAGVAETTCSNGTYNFSINKSAATDGTYSYTITQTDRAGNVSSSTAFQWDITSSNLPPTITTPAANPYYSNGTTLSITGTCASGNTVYLSGFAAANTACSGALAYSFTPNCGVLASCLNDGTYVYSLAQKTTGTMSSAVSKTWIRDTLAPTPVVFASSNPFVSGDSTLTLVGTCEDGATVYLSTNLAVNTTCSNGVFSLNIPTSCSGSCDYTVIQKDLAVNTSPSVTFSWIYESTMPPTPTITSPTSYQTFNKASAFTITGTCSGSNNVILSGVETTSATAILAADVTGGSLTKTCASGLFSFTINKSTDGTYMFSVNQQIPETTNTPAIDSASALRIWVRDTSVPAGVTIINPSAPYSAGSPYTAGGSLYISGTCEDYATVTLSGDTSATTTCTNSFFTFLATGSTDNTSYVYNITQTDRAGNNSTQTTINWYKDPTIAEAPRILNPSVSPYKSNGDSIVISGSCTSGLTVTLGGADSQTMTCTNDQFSFTTTKTSDNTYAYTLSQGNSPNSNVSWIRDASGPVVTIGGSITEGSTNDDFTAIFTLSANEAVKAYQCKLDSGSYAACASPLSFDGLTNTTHTLSVKAIDYAGNWGAVTTRNWTQASNGAIALYHLDSGTTTLTNSSNYGASNDLTASGTSIVSGKISSALDYSSGDSVSVVHHSSHSKLNSRMTAELWFKVSSKPSNNRFTPIVTKMGASGSMGWELGLKVLGSNQYVVFRGSNNGTTTQEVRSTAITLTTGVWHHVAITYNKGTVRFFFNGVTKGTASVSGSVPADLFSSTAPLRLGKSDASSTTEQYTGQIDEVRLSQIIRYSAGFTPSTSAFSAD